MNDHPIPQPGQIAVIFTSQRARGSAEAGDRSPDDGYEEAAHRMLELAAAQPGFLGVESARGADGFGITVSWWATEADVRAWRNQVEHLAAQDEGRRVWYLRWTSTVASVLRTRRGAAGESV